MVVSSNYLYLKRNFWAILKTRTLIIQDRLATRKLLFIVRHFFKADLIKEVILATCRLRKMAARFSGLKIPPDCIGK